MQRERGGKETKKNVFGKVWAFLKADTWQSLIVDLILAFVVIKFVFFPLLSVATGAALPLVIVESCSMYHSDNMTTILENPIYAQHDIYENRAADWPFQSGLSKGDIVFVVGTSEPSVGDVIVFSVPGRNPIIHRVISTDPLTTKGDHNSGQLSEEINISGNAVMGRAVFKVPFLGWAKLIFYESMRAPGEKGLCR